MLGFQKGGPAQNISPIRGVPGSLLFVLHLARFEPAMRRGLDSAWRPTRKASSLLDNRHFAAKSSLLPVQLCPFWRLPLRTAPSWKMRYPTPGWGPN